MELLEQIKKEIEQSQEVMTNWRLRYQDFLGQYINQDKNDGVIHVNTLYSIMQTAMAVEQSDELNVVMMPRRIGDTELAYNLTELAKFDYGVMRMKQKNFQRNWDKWFFGISYLRSARWDKNGQVIESYVCDPMLHLPDPNSDHLTPSRFEYDERRIHKSELKEELGYKSREELDGEIQNIISTATANNIASGLQDIINQDYVDVYDGYTYYNGDLYLVTVDASMGVLLRQEKIEPLNKIEEEQGVPMTRVVNKKWLSPKRYHPCGISLNDIAADKQKVNRILLNLRLTDAKFSTFGQINMVNSRVVKNTVDLTEPSIEPKWVVANVQQGDRLSDAVYTVPRQSIMQDSYAVSNEINQIIQQDTGFDARTLGVQGDKTATLGEVQTIQSNANLRLSLGIEIGNWGEVDFWRDMWYAGYLQYFDKKDMKYIRVTRGLGSSLSEFDYDDFMGGEMFDFTIESKKETDLNREKMKANFMAIYAMMLQDPTTKEYERILLKRTALFYNGLNREEIYAFVQETPDEYKAKEKVKRINEGMETGVVVDSMNEDHFTFIYIFQSARDTKENDLKKKAIENRIKAIILQQETQELEKQQAQQSPNQNTGAANQLVANSMSQNKQLNSLT